MTARAEKWSLRSSFVGRKGPGATTFGKGSGISPVLLVLNGAGALVATGFAVAGLARPSIAEPGSDARPNHLTGFWAASSAVRTVAVTGPLLAGLATGRRPSPQLLTAAAIVQLGDAVLGLRQRNAFMTVAPAAMGLVHLATARRLSR